MMGKEGVRPKLFFNHDSFSEEDEEAGATLASVPQG